MGADKHERSEHEAVVGREPSAWPVSTIRGLIHVYDDVALLEITDPSETTLDAIRVPAAG